MEVQGNHPGKVSTTKRQLRKEFFVAQVVPKLLRQGIDRALIEAKVLLAVYRICNSTNMFLCSLGTAHICSALCGSSQTQERKRFWECSQPMTSHGHKMLMALSFIRNTPSSAKSCGISISPRGISVRFSYHLHGSRKL